MRRDVRVVVEANIFFKGSKRVKQLEEEEEEENLNLAVNAFFLTIFDWSLTSRAVAS